MFSKYTISLLALLMLSACSSDNDEGQESATERITKDIADKAVASIQEPLDKARSAAQKTEEHNQQIEEDEPNMEK